MSAVVAAAAGGAAGAANRRAYEARVNRAIDNEFESEDDRAIARAIWYDMEHAAEGSLLLTVLGGIFVIASGIWTISLWDDNQHDALYGSSRYYRLNPSVQPPEPWNGWLVFAVWAVCSALVCYLCWLASRTYVKRPRQRSLEEYISSLPRDKRFEERVTKILDDCS